MCILKALRSLSVKKYNQKFKPKISQTYLTMEFFSHFHKIYINIILNILWKMLT